MKIKSVRETNEKRKDKIDLKQSCWLVKRSTSFINVNELCFLKVLVFLSEILLTDQVCFLYQKSSSKEIRNQYCLL